MRIDGSVSSGWRIFGEKAVKDVGGSGAAVVVVAAGGVGSVAAGGGGAAGGAAGRGGGGGGDLSGELIVDDSDERGRWRDKRGAEDRGKLLGGMVREKG